MVPLLRRGKGGTPVFLEGGHITKGPAALKGRHIDDLKKSKKPPEKSTSSIDNKSSVDYNTSGGEKPTQTGETKMGMTELPKLTGSGKQVAWAEKIRTGALDLSTYHATLRPVVSVMLPVIESSASEITVASEWIDASKFPSRLLFARRFGVSGTALNEAYRTVEEHIKNVLHAKAKANDEVPVTTLGEYDATRFVRKVGKEKATQIAAAFGFELPEGDGEGLS